MPAWAAVRGAVWLGWLAESNWTDPLLFAGYSVVKPLSQMLILVVMYRVIAGAPSTPHFASILVGNAFFVAVLQLLSGVSYCVVEDREYYSTIRYLYVATRSLAWYLLGRAVAKVGISLVPLAITLAVGRVVLDVPIAVEPARAALGSAALAVGLASTATMGLGLAAVVMLAARQGGMYSEAVTGAIYLLAGVLFPPEVLPRALALVSSWLPQTYWFEAMRRALQPGWGGWSPMLASLSDGALLARLLACGILWSLAGVAAFLVAEHWVRRTGTLDVHTES